MSNLIVIDHITSFDAYTKYTSETTFKVLSYEDNALMYPIYVLKESGSTYISTSVVELIKFCGNFEQNINFNPNYNKRQWYDSNQTVDKRITKVPSLTNFKEKRKKVTEKEFISRSVNLFQEFISNLENTFFDRQFVILTGGRDSRIIWCVPKIYEEKFHVFSSEPNASLVMSWLEKNNISYTTFIDHNNKNDDGNEYLEKKILASDFRCKPADIRWTRSICEIAKRFDYKVVFLTGNAGDTLNACREGSLWKANQYINYFEMQKRQTAALQGTYHQTIFNLTGCPIISIYGFPEIWQILYQEFEPSEFDGLDLRPKIGNLLANQEFKWFGDDSFLRPDDWKTEHTNEELMSIYIDGINKAISDST